MTAKAEIMAVAILATGAIVAPLWLGATSVYGRAAVDGAMLLVALLWALGRRRDKGPLLLPLALTGMGLVQLAPLPDTVLMRIAAGPAALWKAAGEGLPPHWGSISVDPHATAVALLRLFVGLACIVAVRDLARHEAIRRVLIASLGLSAVVILLVGILVPPDRDNTRTILGSVDLSGPIEFWLTPLKRPLETAAFGYVRTVTAGVHAFRVVDWGAGDGFGSFVISNHFAGAVVLTLPCALAWIAFAARKWLPRGTGPVLAVVVSGAALWTVGAMAESRAGAASLLLAVLAFAAFAAEGRMARRITGALATGCALLIVGGAVLLYGQFRSAAAFAPGPLEDKVAAMLADPRAIATRIAFQMFSGSPVFGTGLSTYGEASAASWNHKVPWYFAHNDYAQLLAETGLVGAILACGLATAVIRYGVMFAGSSRVPQRLLDAGPWAAIVGIASHCLFEWNLHIPANAFLACVATGLALASGWAPPVVKGATRLQATVVRGGLLDGIPMVIFCVTCIGAMLMLALDAQAARTERELREAITAWRLAVSRPQKPLPFSQLTKAAEDSELMVARDPGNPQLVMLIGQANLLLSLEPQPIDEANDRREAAYGWFRRARRLSAVLTGIPEE